jgi:hypothetical protein
MRLRFAVIALTVAACGLVAPVRAAEEPAAGLAKYLPEGSAFYVHVNVRQFLAAPVVRKAIPMAVDKFDKQIMMGLQMAMAFAPPGAGNLPEDQIKQGIETLKQPEVIAQAFDAAKDFLTDVVVAGVPGDDKSVVVIIKCNEIVSPDLVKQFAPAMQGNPQIPVQLKIHDKGKVTIYEVSGPNQPQPAFVALPKAGVICLGGSREAVEKAAAGAKNGMKADLKKLVGEENSKDFVFFAMTGGADKEAGVVSGWGRLVLDKDVTAEMSATFNDAKKATDEAKEMNDHLQKFTEMVKEFLGPQAKDVTPVLEKAKATASGSTVNAKFALPGSAVEKLLTKEKK